MKLLIINGSPRGKNSNSTLLSEKFVDGFMSINNHSVDIANIAIKSTRDNIHSQIKECDSIILIFPLYTDCMPGIVMEFFENVHVSAVLKNKPLGFIVHSGFPESKQSTFVEKYLDKLSLRLECKYIGTVIKAGSEGLKIMAPFMTKKIFNQFYMLGKVFAESEAFDSRINLGLRKPYQISAFKLSIIKLLSKTGLTNFYWNMNLKKNNAMHLRDAQPYC